MGQADWSDLTGLNTGEVSRGVTSAFTVPNGGTTFVYGFKSLVDDTGVGAKTCGVSGFTSVGSGGSISAAMKRYSSGTGYAPMIGLLVGNTQSSLGYLLGLTDGTSYKIALKKGAPNTGLDEDDSGILRTSTDSFTDTGDVSDAWFHLRLDVLVNPHNEVVLNVYENDLSSNAVTSPSWSSITGMSQYIDDSLGILTGSSPYTGSFYFFYGHYTNGGNGRVTLWDHVVIGKQTSP